MKRLTWLDDKKEEIIKLHNEDGWTNKQIAEHYGTSTCSINTRLRKWKSNISDCNRNNRVNISEEDIRRMYWDEKMHPSQIAEGYGVCKQTITNKMKTYGIPFRTKSESRMGELNPIYKVGHTEETRKKLSKAYINGRTVGYNEHWGSNIKYVTPNQGEVTMRSSWEVKTADYLTSKGIDWYYEYKRFELDNTSYCPDFYIPSLNLYIEVKGRLKDIDLEKYDAVKDKINIILWDGIELLKLGIIDNCGDANLNRKYRKKRKEI